MSTTTTSKKFWVNARDFIRALGYAMITPVVPIIIQSISANQWTFNWTIIWHTAVGAGVTYLAVKFFTPAQTISTPPKIIILILGLSLLTSGANAQSPFKALPKISRSISPFAHALAPVDSSMNAFRILSVAAAYAEPGNILMAGIGYGYQHLSWDSPTQKWICKWSVSPVAFAGGSVAPSTPASIMSVGILAGINNNLILAGPIYNFGTRQAGIALSIGINFNN